MKKYKNKIIAAVIISLVLAFVFWYGGDSPALRGWSPKSDGSTATIQVENYANEQTDQSAPGNEQEQLTEQTISHVESQSDSEEYSEKHEINTPPDTNIDNHQTEPTTKDNPTPVEPENIVITDNELTCTLSVRCDTILNNIDWLDKAKVDIVPKDGVIYAEKTVTFYEGESVFNLLMREMKRNKIHMEFESTPIYNSAYIEGIANLYEFDCGELSGWMYKVNDWFPNYGCSRYQLKNGDKVEWVYTCDLGIDVDGGYSARNGN